MRMKMFAARTMDDAMAMIAAEMGDDAIILSEREVDGGYEIRAATDKPRAGLTSSRSSNRTPLFSAPEIVQPRLADNPAAQRMRDALIWHGAPKRFIDRACEARRHDEAVPAKALASGLETLIKCKPLPVVPKKDVLLVGPPGHGRTSTAAKLTRRAAMASKKIFPIAADFDATAGGAQLAAYLQKESGQIRTCRTPDELFDLLDEMRRKEQRCVIDLPSIVAFDHEDMSRLKDLVLATNVEPVLVMSAEGHPEDLADTAQAFAQVGVTYTILTKLDVVRRRGGAVAGLASAGLTLSHLATTPFIGGGLVPANHSRLATLLIEDSQGQDALRGAA
ncbi:MAG: flagellar biosynthesis protein FlhF-like protein [Pseudomonadota bacterium]